MLAVVKHWRRPPQPALVYVILAMILLSLPIYRSASCISDFIHYNSVSHSAIWVAKICQLISHFLFGVSYVYVLQYIYRLTLTTPSVFLILCYKSVKNCHSSRSGILKSSAQKCLGETQNKLIL